MKKIFTYLLASAAFCLMGTVNAMADEGTDLTQAMFMDHSKADKPVAAGCAYAIGGTEATGLFYGDGSVMFYNYADLSEYDYLVWEGSITSYPRPYINRFTDNQAAPDAFDKNAPIDFDKQFARDAYMTVNDDKTVFTFNLKKIKEDTGYVRLHCIKGGAWQNGTVRSMKLYKGSVPTAINNVAVESAADAQLYNAAGQKVGKNYKGLVMQKNGKKWMQK